MMDIEAPVNPFPSSTKGPSGEVVYWAPKGSKNPVCEDLKDSAKIEELFDKAVLDWAFLVYPVIDDELYEKAPVSKKWLERLKKEAYGDDAIPFVSVSSIPLNEDYFTDHYLICYFASEPFKLENGSYVTTGVIGP